MTVSVFAQKKKEKVLKNYSYYMNLTDEELCKDLLTGKTNDHYTGCYMDKKEVKLFNARCVNYQIKRVRFYGRDKDAKVLKQSEGICALDKRPDGSALCADLANEIRTMMVNGECHVRVVHDTYP
jgi:hypothetical protein